MSAYVLLKRHYDHPDWYSDIGGYGLLTIHQWRQADDKDWQFIGIYPNALAANSAADKDWEQAIYQALAELVATGRVVETDGRYAVAGGGQ